MTRDDTVRITAGRTVPLPLIPAAGVVVAAASFLLIPLPYAIIVVCLAAVGALVPRTFTTWAAIVVLALAQLAHPLAFDARANALLLVVHLLHVIGALSLALPATGRLQLRALVGPARRWLLLQLPAQALLLIVLAAIGLPLGGVVPAGAVAIVAAVCVVAMVVLVRLLAARR
ncbi:hypothetical protein ET475_17305 [Microbacterium protaetiae]|uniref:Uncharacterized protein n=1 Tax=Microbacterium protaetiae TaxID=2509458 RepID=A0A4P6EJX8_9MICO|nr:hypothetical protein [Microbacterium protaetiae]QAY61549.1 hypothetical protein ET475_17305 [Microbacterium protaetiae]